MEIPRTPSIVITYNVSDCILDSRTCLLDSYPCRALLLLYDGWMHHLRIPRKLVRFLSICQNAWHGRAREREAAVAIVSSRLTYVHKPICVYATVFICHFVCCWTRVLKGDKVDIWNGRLRRIISRLGINLKHSRGLANTYVLETTSFGRLFCRNSLVVGLDYS